MRESYNRIEFDSDLREALKEALECACTLVDANPPDELSWSPLALYHSQVMLQMVNVFPGVQFVVGNE